MSTTMGTGGAPGSSGSVPYLEGVKVLDLTQYLAGPSCTRLLAELGADVIKVEMSPFGDPTRAGVPRRDRRAGGFVQQNRGKRSLCADMRRPEGLALVKEHVRLHEGSVEITDAPLGGARFVVRIPREAL